MKDYYNILRIRPDATPEEIKQGYKNQVKKYHPDNYTGPAAEAQERMVELQEAYDFLSDPVKKKEYDATLRTEAKPPPGNSSQTANSNRANPKPASEPSAGEPVYRSAPSSASSSDSTAEQVGGCIGCLIYLAIAIGVIMLISALLRSCDLKSIGKSWSNSSGTQTEQSDSDNNATNSLPAKDKKMLDMTQRYIQALLAGNTKKMKALTSGNQIRVYSRQVIQMLYGNEEEQLYLQSLQNAMRRMQYSFTSYTIDNKGKNGTVTMDITTVDFIAFEAQIQDYIQEHEDDYVDAIANGEQEDQILVQMINQFIEDGNLTSVTNPLVLCTKKIDGKWQVTGAEDYEQYMTAFCGGNPDDM